MPPSTTSSEFAPSPRSRAESVDMQSVMSSPRAFDLVSEVESLRADIPHSHRASSDAMQPPALSFGAMSLVTEPTLPQEPGSPLGSKLARPSLGRVQDMGEPGGLSRNASLGDLAEVRSVASSEDPFDSMDSFGSGGSTTTDTVARTSMSSENSRMSVEVPDM